MTLITVLTGPLLTILLGPRPAVLSVAAAPTSPLAVTHAAGGGQEMSAEFSRFTHANPNHARLACLLCHRRENNAPRPSLPGHTPCAGCHAAQFADRQSPICTICHTDAESGAVKAFPSLKSFGVRFDHARHAAGAALPATGCAACHRPERRAAALTIPSGFNAHATCYQCHTPRGQGQAGRDISSCGTCHKPGSHTRTAVWTRAYRVNFSHREHVQRASLACAECHRVNSAGLPQGRQVSSPVPSQHFGAARGESCAACHNGRRAFGGDDFSTCKRCHQGTTFRF